MARIGPVRGGTPFRRVGLWEENGARLCQCGRKAERGNQALPVLRSVSRERAALKARRAGRLLSSVMLAMLSNMDFQATLSKDAVIGT